MAGALLLAYAVAFPAPVQAQISTDPVWSTTMTVGLASGDGRGIYHGDDSFGDGTLDNDEFTVSGVLYEVNILQVSSDLGAEFSLNAALPDKDDYILHFAGVQLPLDETTTSNNKYQRWDASWLASNAPSLDATNFENTLPDGGRVPVCLRTATQTCPGGTAATGQPTITGTAQVDQMLTADTSAIMDADGVPGTFTYRWVRVDDLDNETDIGTDSSTYTVVGADVGSTIRVYVNFNDDAGNLERPPGSEETAAVENAPLVWTTTMTVGVASTGAGRGYYLRWEEGGSLEDDDFTASDVPYEVWRLKVDPGDGVEFGTTPRLADRDDYILEWAGAILPLTAITLSVSDSVYWDASWLAAHATSLDAANFETTLPIGGRVPVCLRTATQVCPTGITTSNNPATGMPTITGTAQVGVTLTADTSAIMDADGVPGTFTYRWVRVDAADVVTDIGTDSSTYTLLAADLGSTIRVYVGFTDDAGNPEGPIPSDPTAEVTVPVTIESQHEEIGAGVEDLTFTLTREGETTDALPVKVTIVQDQAWLGVLEYEVTFPIGEASVELTIEATEFSFTPSTTGNLTATVSGDGVSVGGSDMVQIISISEPPFTVSYDMFEYTFAEHAYTDIYVVSTLNVAYPRAPSREFILSYSTRSDTAISPDDYPSLSWQTVIDSSVYAYTRDAETDPFVARMPLSDRGGFAVLDDAIYEGPERFSLIIEEGPGTPSGVAQLRNPDGTICTLALNCPNPPLNFWVNITDDDDLPVLSLSVDPPSIAEEDDDATTGIVENVSTVMVKITNTPPQDLRGGPDGHADLLRGHPGHPLQREPGGRGYKRGGPPGGSAEGDRLG